MIALFVIAGLAPIIASLAVVIWLRARDGGSAAGWIAGRVALGLAAGALSGAAIGLVVMLVVIWAGRITGR